jgi:Predicted ABC-type transport system involved in lysophospholipase L1 biosynthesis, permease component
MYFRILAKDLKRKKTMNIILLIFIILAATFISSSMNNLIAITSAMDHYFQKAELKDFMILTMKDEKNDNAIAKFLSQNKNVESWSVDENLYVSREDLELHGGKDFEFSNVAFINSYNIKQQKFFDSTNREITKVKDGEIYLPKKVMESAGIEPGDVITIKSDGLKMDFKVIGNCKDAFLGSSMMGAARFLVSDDDYEKLKGTVKLGSGSIYSVKASNLAAFEKDYNNMGFDNLVSCDKSLISFTYIMDMIIAGILLVVSICLILISLVILRFTIVFTLNEEFREIGVMKAIGIGGRKIRGLYIVKYLAISSVGAALGFILGIPFGNMFLQQVSQNIIMEKGAAGLVISFLCSILIVVIVILFCYSCTRQVNKFSPIDAIRNGSNGERFKRKGSLNLSRSKLSAVWFMAVNDILSGLKKFSVLIITFTIGIILVIVPVNTINTMRDDNLITLFDKVKSDAYLINENNFKLFREKGRTYMESYLKDMADTITKEGMPSEVFSEMLFKLKITNKDLSFISLAEQGTFVSADQYAYTEGQAPKYANEVALTHVTADKVDAKIGDTVKIKIGGEEQKFLVTAYFQSLNNLGEGIRFSEKAKLDYSAAAGGAGIQVKFTDHPSTAEINNRMKKLKNMFPEYQVNTGREYINNMLGGVAKQLEGIKKLIVVVILIINALVVILMVKTFITKEKGEIGMLKSLGFHNATIMKWQSIRIGIVLFVSILLGALVSNPIARITAGKIFQMMGASHIDFVIKPFEVYVFYPVIIFAITMGASILTAMQIRRITARETNNIE